MITYTLWFNLNENYRSLLTVEHVLIGLKFKIILNESPLFLVKKKLT